jgi:hypothetical protein
VTATVAQLGARALRKLGIAIVADASRPAEGAVVAAADVAARVLLELGIPVPEANRTASAGTITQAEIASRALRAVNIDPAPLTEGIASGLTYDSPTIATSALLKLGVIASDEVPSPTDQAEALSRVTGVHDLLVGLDYVTWPMSSIPANVAEFYIIMAANLLAPQFGKPAAMDAFNAAQAGIRMQALSGTFGQTLALAKVQEVHETLNDSGLLSFPITAIPLGQAESYVRMTAVLLAPVMGYQQDAQSRQVERAAWDAAIVDVRRQAVIAGAQARALAKVQAVQAELNDLGLVTWTADAIPASLADAMASMAAMQMGPEFGKEFDPKMYAFNQDRVRRVSMGGPAGQALAEQKVRAVHYSLDARGRTRWTLYDLPEWAEEPYVLMAATLLAPECGAKADPTWYAAADMDLMRIVSLPSEREPVRAVYF